ncbi:MAG TPA: hypothetical protein VKQ31_10155 [Steroidobacteraceae bacterium]|nr:hypothetical protein [Steroidobacteraceae bacterium]
MRANILLPAAALLALSTAGYAAETSWRDIESRIQYGYYTEDVPALRSLAGLIAADESHDKLHGYYAALLNWRLAQLAAQGVSREAPAAAMVERCVSAADDALAAQADFADALALRAACQGTPIPATDHGLFSGHRRLHRDLERARQLSPHDPRVLLVDAMNDYQLPRSAGGNKERALPKLRLAVAAFEAERAGLERLPGWGAAEAYLFLARELLDHGDAIAARDALEHALLIAPEFAQARRLMAKIIAG